MITGGSFEYAQARLQSRLARRPGIAGWARLDAAHDAAAFLDAARTAMPAIAGLGITAATPVHTLEQRLADAWRAAVAELAAWLPDAWRPAVEWCAALARLPAVLHLARGGPEYGWMLADRELRAVVEAGRAHDPDGATARGVARGRAFDRLQGRWAALAASARDGLPGERAWALEWRRRLPAMDDDSRAGIDDLARVVARHVGRYVRASVPEAGQLRRDLDGALIACLRRRSPGAAASFAYLALVALDLERFRGALVRRLLFARA